MTISLETHAQVTVPETLEQALEQVEQLKDLNTALHQDYLNQLEQYKTRLSRTVEERDRIEQRSKGYEEAMRNCFEMVLERV